jgi:hypothetical protein
VGQQLELNASSRFARSDFDGTRLTADAIFAVGSTHKAGTFTCQRVGSNVDGVEVEVAAGIGGSCRGIAAPALRSERESNFTQRFACGGTHDLSGDRTRWLSGSGLLLLALALLSASASALPTSALRERCNGENQTECGDQEKCDFVSHHK